MMNTTILLEMIQPIINKVIKLGYTNKLQKDWLADDIEKILNVDKYSSLASIKVFNDCSIKIELNKNLFMSMNVDIPYINKKDIEKISEIIDMIESFNEEIKKLR